MREFLDSLPTGYIDAASLLSFLKEYANPRDCISRAVKNGLLIRVKNGFYLISSKFKWSKDYPFEQIGNLLYGPSYISLEWALSYYHLIPERVMAVTSVTTGSNKEFLTPIGNFYYRHLSLHRYSIGISHQDANVGGFLIATPEKALADSVFFSSKHLSEEELKEDLLEGRRMEITALKDLQIDHLRQIAEAYRSPSVTNLYKVISKL